MMYLSIEKLRFQKYLNLYKNQQHTLNINVCNEIIKIILILFQLIVLFIAEQLVVIRKSSLAFSYLLASIRNIDNCKY